MFGFIFLINDQCIKDIRKKLSKNKTSLTAVSCDICINTKQGLKFVYGGGGGVGEGKDIIILVPLRHEETVALREHVI